MKHQKKKKPRQRGASNRIQGISRDKACLTREVQSSLSSPSVPPKTQKPVLRFEKEKNLSNVERITASLLLLFQTNEEKKNERMKNVACKSRVGTNFVFETDDKWWWRRQRREPSCPSSPSPSISSSPSREPTDRGLSLPIREVTMTTRTPRLGRDDMRGWKKPGFDRATPLDSSRFLFSRLVSRHAIAPLSRKLRDTELRERAILFRFWFWFWFWFRGEEKGWILSEVDFLWFYIYIVENIFIRFVGKKIEWNDFSEVTKEGFSVFIARRLKYDEAKERRGVIYSTYC